METMNMFHNVAWAPAAGHVYYSSDADWQQPASAALRGLGDQELCYDYTHVPEDEQGLSDYYDQGDMDYTEEHPDDNMVFEDSNSYHPYDTHLQYTIPSPVESEQHTFEQSQEYQPSTIPTQGQWSTACPTPSTSTLADTSAVNEVPMGYHYDPEVAKLLENAKPAIPFGVQHYFPWSGRVVCRAHQPIPLPYQSRYSELTPHLDFMKKLEQGNASGGSADQSPQSHPNKSTQNPPGAIPITGPTSVPPTAGSSEDTGTVSATSAATTTKQTLNPGTRIRQTQRPILPSPARIKMKKSSNLVPPAAAASSRARPRPTAALFIRTDPATGKMVGCRARESTKKPSLACKFCKERKIACGRPPEDAEDQTCK